MDRELSKKEKRKSIRILYYKILITLFLIGGIITGLVFFLETDIEGKNLRIAVVEKGRLESSVSASGKIVPLYEQAIISPVATKILEVYCDEGDSVVAGESLLKLDLQSAETEVRKLSDEVDLKNIAIEQTFLTNETELTDLEMKIKTKEMSLDHLKAEVANEKRLDSIGTGTGDRIREAELAFYTGQLELEQMKIQLQNEKKVREALYRSKQLEGVISQRNLQEMERTLEDAGIRAPRNGVVTFLNKSLGTSIAAGEKLAVVSDLSHFKISGEISEGNSGKLSVGSEVKVRFNKNTVTGHISSISPQSQNGTVDFNVILDDDSDKRLRSGLRTELNVIYDIQDEVVRIPNGQYFTGPGEYYLFVKTTAQKLERRLVNLGDSNFDYVEVKSGLSPGEEVVVTDMTDYKNRKSISLK
ncbi:MAG: HlyD family efflux transporter periplasmic adaptor subunit [Muribaculaceae bacterium]|nr:HlyD family efflux transporter periplasmic adaptor subunit [Muribaculaceae bacterium]